MFPPRIMFGHSPTPRTALGSGPTFPPSSIHSYTSLSNTFHPLTSTYAITMVLVEEVPEEVLLREGEHDSDFETDSNASDASSIFSDDDDYIKDESLYDRVVALKDIVPPNTRSSFVSKYNATKAWATWGFQSAGSIAWWVSTSALLVGLPMALVIEDEMKVVQQEREMQMQSSGQQQVGSVPADQADSVGVHR